MPKLKRLSGEDIVSILRSFGFSVLSQRGSHIKIRRMVNGMKQTLTIPNHAEMDTGTTHAIYRQALKFIPESELKEHFYSS